MQCLSLFIKFKTSTSVGKLRLETQSNRISSSCVSKPSSSGHRPFSISIACFLKNASNRTSSSFIPRRLCQRNFLNLSCPAGIRYAPCLSISIFLVSAIALPGFRPLGHVDVQFIIVWHRYSLNGSSRASRRSPVSSSRESINQR